LFFCNKNRERRTNPDKLRGRLKTRIIDGGCLGGIKFGIKESYGSNWNLFGRVDRKSLGPAPTRPVATFDFFHDAPKLNNRPRRTLFFVWRAVIIGQDFSKRSGETIFFWRQENNMATIHVEHSRNAPEVLQLVRSAVESEIGRLQIGLKLALNRLKPFEEKYGVTSDYFIAHMCAEDLEGKDEEYVRWAGEYKLMGRLREKLRKLQDIEYEN
jgi:hypothetical protein